MGGARWSKNRNFHSRLCRDVNSLRLESSSDTLRISWGVWRQPMHTKRHLERDWFYFLNVYFILFVSCRLTVLQVFSCRRNQGAGLWRARKVLRPRKLGWGNELGHHSLQISVWAVDGDKVVKKDIARKGWKQGDWTSSSTQPQGAAVWMWSVSSSSSQSKDHNNHTVVWRRHLEGKRAGSESLSCVTYRKEILMIRDPFLGDLRKCLTSAHKRIVNRNLNLQRTGVGTLKTK